MSKEIVGYGSTSRVEWFFIPDSTSITGAGKTALAFNTSGLRIDIGRPGDAAATSYTVAAGNIETIATIGTYAAPTANKVRFKEIDSVALPGWYEVQFADALYNSTGSRKSLCGMIHGATGAAPTPFQIQLDLAGTTIKELSATGLDLVLIEAAISASASLTNDTGTQLTSINARQAMSAMLSALAGVLSGVATNALEFKPGGKSAGNTRITATQAADGRTSVAIKVPD